MTFHGQRVSFRKSSRRKWHQLTTHRLLVRPSDHMGRKFQEAGTNRCQLLEKLDRFLFSRYFHPLFCKAQSPRFWWLLRERWYCLVSDHSEWSCPWVCRGSQVRIESVLCIILLIFLKLEVDYLIFYAYRVDKTILSPKGATKIKYSTKTRCNNILLLNCQIEYL